MKLGAILFQIDEGTLVLPTFQRGYVWNRGQVRKLMRSLYRNYPVGGFLVWETQSNMASAKGNSSSAGSAHNLLLDGQQRITSLYGIIRGKRPDFSDANESTFLNLYFHVEDEEFEFYGPTKMKGNPYWINVTELMQKGVGPFFPRFLDHPKQTEYVNRLLSIHSITGRDFHIDKVSDEIATDDERLIDVVVDIFNEVNSGGTKLSKGDLALAKICADWPQAREEMQVRLDKWHSFGYRFSLDWLLRCINALLTDNADPAELDRRNIEVDQIQDGLRRAEQYIDQALKLIATRLGLDYHQVLGSPNALPAIICCFDKQKSWPGHKTLDRLLYWYVHAMLWGRYSGPVETVIRQDIMALYNDDAISALIELLRQQRGNLRVEPQDFAGATRGSRFYPLLYMLTRIYGTKDFDSGLELRQHLLGGSHQLELHHVFPKARLTKYGYHWRNDANALANFTFLTEETNRRISAKLPEEYFRYYEAKHPGVLESHWIPDDPALWKIENYREFLAARRELLAKAANSFLDQLLHGAIDEPNGITRTVAHDDRPRPISVASDEEAQELEEAMDWIERHGLPRGEFGYELLDADNEQIATLDLAWPQGIQTGLGDAVALLIDENDDTLRLASSRGFRCFTSLAQFQTYVQRDILGEPA